MPRSPGTAKKLCTPPSLEALDTSPANEQLKSKGDPKDPNTPKMLSLIEGQLKKRLVTSPGDGVPGLPVVKWKSP
jgi:hypothetical protein